MTMPDEKAYQRTHTGNIRDLEKVVRAMPKIGSSAFRVFTGIASGLNCKSGQYFVTDEVLAVECGFRQRQSLWEARKQLKAAGLIDFESGHLTKKKATTYWLTISIEDVRDRLTLLLDQKEDARSKAKNDEPRRTTVRKRLRSLAVQRCNDRKQTLTQEPPGPLPNAYAGPLPNAYALHPQAFTPSDSATDRELDLGHTRGTETVPHNGAYLSTVCPSPSLSSAPSAHPAPILVDDVDDEEFEREVLDWLGEGDVVRGCTLADFIPTHMRDIRKAGSMTAAGPLLKQARTAAISIEHQFNAQKSKVA